MHRYNSLQIETTRRLLEFLPPTSWHPSRPSHAWESGPTQALKSPICMSLSQWWYYGVGCKIDCFIAKWWLFLGAWILTIVARVLWSNYDFSVMMRSELRLSREKSDLNTSVLIDETNTRGTMIVHLLFYTRTIKHLPLHFLNCDVPARRDTLSRAMLTLYVFSSGATSLNVFEI